MPKIILKKGAIHLAVMLLLVLSLVAVASVSIFAKSQEVKRTINSKYFSKSTPRPLPPKEAVTISPQGPCYPYSDVDNNGKVNSDDVTAILQHEAGIKPLGKDFLKVADVNGDGNVNSVDAQLIKQYLAGSLRTFAACPTPTISSVSPIPLRVEAGQLVGVYGTRFGSTRGRVTFASFNYTYDCGFGANTAWYDSRITCSIPARSPVNQTVKVSVTSSDGRVSAPYSVWTGAEATSSADTIRKTKIIL